ncbi:MAG: hypothetical protein F6K19_42425 [Cyanothece sp. SIO1E1]|nr:hypothetical protein [Cyanothece sp. SIO1E1]
MPPLLPQNDPNSAIRRQFLTRQQASYRYNHAYLPPLTFADEVPRAAAFSWRYRLNQLQAIIQIVLNLGIAKLKQLFDPFNHLDDYSKLLVGAPLLPKPALIDTFLLDTEFANQRLAGANPLVIERVDEPKLDSLLQRFPLTDDLFQQIVGTKETLKSAAQAGQLYLTDYAFLDGIELGRYKKWQKFATAPLALYYWQTAVAPSQGRLMPVAIQLHQQPGPGNPVFTPLDGSNWYTAKLFVQIADGNHHELFGHLALTHLRMEPFVLATARQLASNHPLRLLLSPHFQFTLAINHLARTILLKPGGSVEQLLVGTRQASLSLVAQILDAVPFTDAAFPKALKHRGVDDPKLLPNYPYRDDGYLLWEAIHQFVTDYLNLYYKTATDVVEDYELQQWTHELIAQDGGRVNGLTADNKLDTQEKLVELVTQIIFTCGPQHAAVNYTQYDYGAFVANMPASGYAFPSTQNKINIKSENNSELLQLLSPFLIKFMPPPKLAIAQLATMSFLTAFQYNRLGYYERGHFQDPEAQKLVKAFQKDLDHIEAQINQRNQQRNPPYSFLKPSLVPNGLNL